LTILKHEKIQVVSRGKLINRFRSRITIICNYCKKEKIFEKCPLEFIEKPFHYSCKQCFYLSNSDGDSAKLRKRKFKEKTGKEYPLQVESINSALKANNLEKYGVENVSQLQDIKDKKIQTLLQNYGVKSPLQSKDILYKSQETNNQRYGDYNAMKNPDI